MTDHPPITRHQLVILKLRLVTGSRKAAAERLNLSPWTVHSYLGQMLRECGCNDDAQAGWVHRKELATVRTQTLQ